MRAGRPAGPACAATYDQVSGDLTQANYSSLRAGKIEFRRLCEQVQYGILIPMLVRPVADIELGVEIAEQANCG